MRIGQGLSSLDLYKLFTEHLERQRVVPPVRQQPGQEAQQPGRLTFKFLDSFESSANGAQQWLVRREIGESPSVASPKATKSAGANERVTRTLFSDGFEPPRVPPVDLGQTRSTVNRFQPSTSQDNGFHASVNDL